MKFRRICLPTVLATVFCSLLAAWPASARSAIIGIAAMGASETAGDTEDGSWVPWLATERGLNFGPGQSYNKAIGGNSSAALLANGQHTQVASLVAQGSVNLAFLTVGGLDFPPVTPQILNDTLNKPAFVAQVTGNIGTAVDTVLAAGPTQMIVLSIPDMSLTGGGQRTLTTPAQRQAVVDVVNQVNATLEPQILGKGQVYVDFAGVMREWSLHPLVVGGVTIDTQNEGASANHLWLNDLHVAVVGNALLANLMLSAINKEYGTAYPLFSDQFILQKAGLSGYTGETSNIDFASFVHLPVPEPATNVLMVAGAVALLLVGKHRKRNRSNALLNIK